ncbi:MAG: hypothetical protein WDW36_001737 [Sanguina aurantia]
MAHGDNAPSIHPKLGILHKGSPPTKNAPGVKGVSSIPAKFETVLSVGPRERKGFGSERKRFIGAEQDTPPGPGSYDRGLTMGLAHGSMSRKGYGPMVSVGRRFRTERAYYTGPGPCEYASRGAHPSPSDFNRSPATSAFHSRGSTSAVPVDPGSESSPGPGSYNWNDTTRTGRSLDYLARHGATSAFRARPHQSMTSVNLDSPSPTAYTMADPWDPRSTRASLLRSGPSSRAGTSAFAGGPRSPAGATASLPALLYGADAPDAKPDPGPGPGSYELNHFDTIQAGLGKGFGRMSAPFHIPESVDRFGRLRRAPATPNSLPGHVRSPLPTPFDVPSSSSSSAPTSPTRMATASFKSLTAGHAEFSDLQTASRPAPGPAFYRPKAQPQRQSFHINARKRYH